MRNLLIYTLLLLIPLGAAAQNVNIPDPNLRAILNAALEKPANAEITEAEMETLTWIESDDSDVGDLTGLAFATRLEGIRLEGGTISDLSPLSELRRLEQIHFPGHLIEDLSPISTLTRLENLSVDLNVIQDISPIQTLTRLERLNIGHNFIQDFSPIGMLLRLKRISMSRNPPADLSSFAALTNLESFHSWGTPILGVSGLSQLPHLTSLDICGGDLTDADISVIGGMTQLTKLYLAGNEFTDITPLARLTNLRELALHQNRRISDLQPIVALENLTWLNLHRTDISDLQPIVALENLTHLDLHDNDISDLQPIVALENLTHLDLHNTGISDLQPIAALENLTWLNLHNTGISDLQPIAALENLTWLNLHDNNISDIQPIAELNNLTWVGLSNNNISDFSPLESLPEVNAETENNPGSDSLAPHDVNGDGSVSILDLIAVAAQMGRNELTVPRADVNGDGVVNIQDITLVANNFDEVPGAPAITGTTSAELIETLLLQARAADDGSLTFREGIANLQQLLASLVPQETRLLANYPNPFNPETWIPYHLSADSEVAVTIYAATGEIVRRLTLGHQGAGYYTDRSRAAYWDGRNDLGESVSSGVYFYELRTDQMSLLRKMVILK